MQVVQAEQLAKQVTILNRLKTENEEIYYSVDQNSFRDI